jgi:hypothetical protein
VIPMRGELLSYFESGIGQFQLNNNGSGVALLKCAKVLGSTEKANPLFCKTGKFVLNSEGTSEDMCICASSKSFTFK